MKNKSPVLIIEKLVLVGTENNIQLTLMKV